MTFKNHCLTPGCEVLALTLRSPVHFLLIFVYGKKESNFILSHVAIQLSQQYVFTKDYSFTIELSLNPFEYQLIINIGVYF